MTATKKLFGLLVILLISLSSFVSADMTKQKACKLKDGSYPRTNLTTVWKPYVEYNKNVRNSYQKKTATVDGFYKANGFLYYIVHFQIQDMTYTVRANLFSYNCKKTAIKQLSPINFATGSYAYSDVVNTDGSKFMLSNYRDGLLQYYSIFSKITNTNTKIIGSGSSM